MDRGNEFAPGRVAVFEVVFCHPLHIGELQGLDPVARQKEQAPVAIGNRVGEAQRQRLRAVQGALDVGEHGGFGARQFGCGNRLLCQVFQLRTQASARSRRRLFLGQFSHEDDVTGLGQRKVPRPDRDRLTAFDQRFVQAPVGGVTHDLGQRGHGCGIRVAGGCCVVEQTQQGRITDAVHAHLARAVLRRVPRVSGFQSAGRPGYRPKRGLHQSQRPSTVKLARNHQHRVVGLVIAAVKGLQVLDAHVLHIGARADGGFAVVVPIESRCCHALPEHPAGAVLARLHLVAHHAELGLQIALRNTAVDHAVGFHLQGPAQVVITGAKALKVVGAVV